MSNLIPMVLLALAVLGVLALDLGVLNRHPHQVSAREAAVWSAVWITLSVAAGVGIYFWKGSETSIQFFTAYVVEKSLSLDNIFLFSIIFSSLAVLPKYQHRLLFWGVLGALFLRGAMIAAGAIMIARFEWVLWIIGAVLIITGVRVWGHEHKAPDPERNIAVRGLRRLFPIAHLSDGSFFVRRGGRWFATSLFVALVMIEVVDIVMALDSIPAVFAVTRDPFVVYASNILAILGMRSLYFLLAGFIDKLRYLRPGLAIILVFVGFKMLISGFYEIPLLVSSGAIMAILAITFVFSLCASRPPRALCANLTAAGVTAGTREETEGSNTGDQLTPTLNVPNAHR
jgi:tellurite resistance protein TerC